MCRTASRISTIEFIWPSFIVVVYTCMRAMKVYTRLEMCVVIVFTVYKVLLYKFDLTILNKLTRLQFISVVFFSLTNIRINFVVVAKSRFGI